MGFDTGDGSIGLFFGDLEIKMNSVNILRVVQGTEEAGKMVDSVLSHLDEEGDVGVRLFAFFILLALLLCLLVMLLPSDIVDVVGVCISNRGPE